MSDGVNQNALVLLWRGFVLAELCAAGRCQLFSAFVYIDGRGAEGRMGPRQSNQFSEAGGWSCEHFINDVRYGGMLVDGT